MKRVLIASLVAFSLSAIAADEMPDDLREAMVVDLDVCVAHEDISEARKCLDDVAHYYAEQWAERNRQKIESAQRRADGIERRRLANLRSQWEVSDSVDPLTDKPIRTLSLISDNTHRFRFPFNDDNHMAIQIRTHPRFGNDVILHLLDGQFACYSTRCKIGFRIDGGNLITVDGSRSTDGSSRTIFVSGNRSQLINQLTNATSIIVTTTVHEGGNPIFEFTAKK